MRIFIFLISIFFLFPSSHAALEDLEKQLAIDLERVGNPPEWRARQKDVLDVAIIGAGMAGTSAAFALNQMGILNICLFDQNPEGTEGPWLTYAHMKTLRSSKCATGPCLFIPTLTFQAWYEAKHGADAWHKMERATNAEWMEYLYWYRKVLKLPVVNEYKLEDLENIAPNLFRLTFNVNGTEKVVLAQKVILATGRAGFGGYEIPAFMDKVPKKFYAHTAENIPFDELKDKRIAVIGCGASAFDTAGMALEHDAAAVDMLFRRETLPSVNKFAEFAYAGFEQGFHKLSDAWRWAFIAYACSYGIPPTPESVERVQKHPQFQLKPKHAILQVLPENNMVTIETSQGFSSYDMIILATGFHLGGDALPELGRIVPHAALWRERIQNAQAADLEHLGSAPYLGDHYQMIEKKPGDAPYLKHLYCFNYGALISQGLTSSSIDAISVGALRLAQGIAADFFTDDVEHFYHQLENYE